MKNIHVTYNLNPSLGVGVVMGVVVEEGGVFFVRALMPGEKVAPDAVLQVIFGGEEINDPWSDYLTPRYTCESVYARRGNFTRVE